MEDSSDWFRFTGLNAMNTMHGFEELLLESGNVIANIYLQTTT